MQLNKRRNIRSAFDESNIEECLEVMPFKRISCSKPKMSMDIEIDFDHTCLEQLYTGDSRDQLGFLDMQVGMNKYTPNPIWSDSALIQRYQRIALERLTNFFLEYTGMSKSEVKKKLKDTCFIEKMHHYFISLSNARRILPE